MKITVRITDACPPPIAPKNSIYGSPKLALNVFMPAPLLTLDEPQTPN
jgi:hypothetical protein